MARRSRRRRDLGKAQFLILPALAFLMAAAVFLMKYYIAEESEFELEDPVYQYFLDNKMTYPAGTKLVMEEQQAVFEHGGERDNSDTTPAYFENKKMLVLPIDMSWLDPATLIEWRLPAFGRLEMDENGLVWYSEKENRCRLNGGLLSNGRGTYVFLEDASLLFDGTTYNLKPFSFYSCVNDLYRIYSYGGEMKVMTQRKEIVRLRSQSGFQVNLTAGIFTSVNGEQMLLVASPVILKDIWER